MMSNPDKANLALALLAILLTALLSATMGYAAGWGDGYNDGSFETLEIVLDMKLGE